VRFPRAGFASPVCRLFSGDHLTRGLPLLLEHGARDGKALFEKLRPAHRVRDVLRTLPRGSQALPFVEPSGQHAVQAPRLLRTYLEPSAKICGPPAIDREFKTIDFRTLLDLEEIPARLRTRLAAE